MTEYGADPMIFPRAGRLRGPSARSSTWWGKAWVRGFEETVLEPRATTVVRLPLKLDWSNVKSAGLDILFSGSIHYAVEGEVTFSTPAGVYQRPYHHAGEWSAGHWAPSHWSR